VVLAISNDSKNPIFTSLSRVRDDYYMRVIKTALVMVDGKDLQGRVTVLYFQSSAVDIKSH